MASPDPSPATDRGTADRAPANASRRRAYRPLKNPIGLVYAAIFGLTPGALTSRLTAASARLQPDLQSTEAAASVSTAPDQGVQ